MCPLPPAQAEPPPQAARSHWSDGLFAFRDRLLASARFRRWAQAFPFTRRVARRRAAAVFDLMAGFVYAQVLLACVQLRLFELLLADGPQSPADLAVRWQMPALAVDRLLRAAVALDLLQWRRYGRVGLGALGAPLAADAGLAALVVHHASLYRDLADPLALLRGQSCSAEVHGSTGEGPHGQGTSGQGTLSHRGLADFWPYAGTEAPQDLAPHRLSAYSDLMASSQPLVADQVLRAYALHHHRRLLDVGGGSGSFACRAAVTAPNLQVQVFDLPGVAARAQARFAQAGLSGRCTAVGGDFLRDPLPQGADLATLLRVVHDHDDARVLCLLRAVRQALVPGGCLLLAEPFADTPGAKRMGHAYFGIYLLAMGRGEPRTEARLRDLLAQAGFEHVRRLATSLPLQASALLAKTPV